MEFHEQIKQFSKRIGTLKDNISTEEATKMSLVIPLFKTLGYDVYNPLEFCPEYTADVGIKKGEKVDYAILENGNPTIIVECKSCSEELDKHSSQLFRYFGTTAAKFGILTNGLIYKFYTDLDEGNKMDLVPFLEIDMLNLKDVTINELKRFCKDVYDTESIFNAAEELKYSGLIKNYLAKELDNPSDDFVRYIADHVYDGKRTQKVIDKFQPLVKKSFTAFISDIVNQKITSALSKDEEVEVIEIEKTEEKEDSEVEVTAEEMEAFHVIRAMLSEVASAEEIAHRSTASYFGVLYTDNNRKPICRLMLNANRKQVLIPDEEKNFERFYIENPHDIYKHKEQLIEVVKRYL